MSKPTPDASPDPAVVQVLAGHVLDRGRCFCGFRIDYGSAVSWWDQHAQHVAQALAAAGFGDVRAVEAERDRASAGRDLWRQSHALMRQRAEAAEKELAGLVAKIEALADEYEVLADYTDDPDSTVEQQARARAGVVAAEHLRALIPADAATALDMVREKAAVRALREAAAEWESEYDRITRETPKATKWRAGYRVAHRLASARADSIEQARP